MTVTVAGTAAPVDVAEAIGSRKVCLGEVDRMILVGGAIDMRGLANGSISPPRDGPAPNVSESLRVKGWCSAGCCNGVGPHSGRPSALTVSYQRVSILANKISEII